MELSKEVTKNQYTHHDEKDFTNKQQLQRVEMILLSHDSILIWFLERTVSLNPWGMIVDYLIPMENNLKHRLPCPPTVLLIKSQASQVGIKILT